MFKTQEATVCNISHLYYVHRSAVGVLRINQLEQCSNGAVQTSQIQFQEIQKVGQAFAQHILNHLMALALEYVRLFFNFSSPKSS